MNAGGRKWNLGDFSCRLQPVSLPRLLASSAPIFFFYNCAKQSMCQCLLLELYTFQATSGRVDKQTRLV